MTRSKAKSEIEWRDWSEGSFEEARKLGRLILLDLTASWCHWCHVMDETTYSDPEIALTINQEFIPIRVDIDRRPDISERYNRGGFPTTAFLSDKGESVWGTTYVPPADMRRIMSSILAAKKSGQIDAALELHRIKIPGDEGEPRMRTSVDSGLLISLFEDMFAAYDVEFGGFGIEPKFPHPDVIELLLTRYAETSDMTLLSAATDSLEKMLSGLMDREEGGVFRYSVTRDWRTPHYEKMLETNVGLLRNLVHANEVVRDRGFDVSAREIARYMLTSLWDKESGGFCGSQDADEEYYKLDAKGRESRHPPAVDKTVYAGWNADASAVLAIGAIILEDEAMLEASRSSWKYMIQNLWNPDRGLVRHISQDEHYLFEDQVLFLRALLAQMAVSADADKTGIAEKLIEGVALAFANSSGGLSDIIADEHAIGSLETPKVILVDNANWALELARFGAATHQSKHVDKARAILSSFAATEVELQGVFAAAYIRARWALEKGMKSVEIHSSEEEAATGNTLLISTLRLFDPSVVVTLSTDRDLAESFAVVCTDSGCSHKIKNSKELLAFISQK